jgi:hypothetical protein
MPQMNRRSFLGPPKRAFRLELGLEKSNFIDYGYWDSLRKGLLAGERLSLDLKRMDSAYLEQNRREFEITKHVSLLALNPYALVGLRQLGKCEFEIPEVFYDFDLPGHFMRRIKSVSVTVPCVSGPYTGVNGTLTLLKSSFRRSPTAAGGYARRDDGAEPDARFFDDFRSIQSVVTSSAQNDAGLFEVNLRDERYLPFEGAGAISSWRLELPEFRAFDYETITDVILHVRYTARDGGASLRLACSSELVAALNAIERRSIDNGLLRLFSIRHEFPMEWRRLTATANGDAGQPLAIAKDRFPFPLQRRELEITRVHVMVVPAAGRSLAKFRELGISTPSDEDLALDDEKRVGQLRVKTSACSVEVAPRPEKARWTVAFTGSADELEKFRTKVADVLLLYHYRVGSA